MGRADGRGWKSGKRRGSLRADVSQCVRQPDMPSPALASVAEIHFQVVELPARPRRGNDRHFLIVRSSVYFSCCRSRVLYLSLQLPMRLPPSFAHFEHSNQLCKVGRYRSGLRYEKQMIDDPLVIIGELRT